ncbi:hypothetical protein [Paenibacillus wenxiniae]|uniref:Gliding motility protein n=1 Tax=Paenibacillus wenxiniae TaxID=1636843 RepID=A0ABW4RDB5_9BACL
MFPTVGDIYCTYSNQLQQYTACQVTALQETEGKNPQMLASIVQLDWSGDQPLENDQLAQLKPLIRSFYFWNGDWDHRFVEATIPADYSLVGNIPPLVATPSHTYDTNWDIGDSLYQQRKWEAIDEKRRQLFKNARNDTGEIMIGGVLVKKNTSTLRNFSPASDADIAALEQLYCLTHIEMNYFTEAIIPFLQQHPFVNELHIDQHDLKTLDLSHTHLSCLILHRGNLETLTLNKHMEFLSLTGEHTSPLHVHADQDGCDLTLSVYVPSSFPALTGLDRLHTLQIHGIEQLDLEIVTTMYTELNELRLTGKPGTISGLLSIKRLRALQFLSMFDLFGFTGDDFPDPEQLPQLRTLWLTSLPADAARSIKARYKKAASTTIELDITQPRKPEWLAENLNNPFRDWDGRAHIKATDAKKAATLYKQCLKNIRNWTQTVPDRITLTAQLTAMIEMYTETFNQMDAQSAFIDTIEREEIYAALNELFHYLQQQLVSRSEPVLDVHLEELEHVFQHHREF